MIRRILQKVQAPYWIRHSHSEGWRSNTPVLVIESDDWGSIRMPNRTSYDALAAQGYKLHRSVLCTDMRERCEDLLALFEVLDAHRDSRGRPACLTGNMVLANPDFTKIRNSNFSSYEYSTLATETGSQSDYGKVLQLMQEGLQQHIFIPQFHTREHIRWWMWLEGLRAGSNELRTLFELGISSLPKNVSKEGWRLDGPVYAGAEELAHYGVSLKKMIEDGIQIFRSTFGFSPVSAIAPYYTWDDDVERFWQTNGIRYIQSSLFQLIGNSSRRKCHFTGQRAKSGLLYTVRNCNFEQNDGGDKRLAHCLAEIEKTFKRNQPAILCSHRINYVGGISPENRDVNLHLLSTLLQTVLERWPNVIFLSSPELGFMIEKGINDPRKVEFSPSQNEVLIER
jgi:hypothetical protein